LNTLNVEYRKVEALIPYARNPRTHSDAQIAKIAASIVEYGWTNPVLVDGDNGIIAGHGRLAAARKLGLDQVPVIELAHLTTAQKRAWSSPTTGWRLMRAGTRRCWRWNWRSCPKRVTTWR
jgi:ParB-like chromosome segregation protein Spo0J